MSAEKLSFQDTSIAFRSRTDAELKKARLLFKSFNYPILLKVGPPLARIGLGLGLKGFIKETIFSQFCGGEDIAECSKTIGELAKYRVGTILDYSVEGEETEEVFNATKEEIIHTIDRAKGNSTIPFSVFKTTGIGRFDLLAKVNSNQPLSEDEQQEFQRLEARFEAICKAAWEAQVRIFVDAEESWIQDVIDQLAMKMMAKYNTEKAIVFNTIQLYRHDRLAYLKETIQNHSFYMGFKLVRGAYMEKERKRAEANGYSSPIQPNKISADKDYDDAIQFCLNHLQKVSFCAGTHNEESSMKLAKSMDALALAPNDERIWFSQLLGMSDHISFNLANAGYNVAKYVPYGPVSAVIPYLTRRAQENSSVKGQTGRELNLINTELKRRKLS